MARPPKRQRAAVLCSSLHQVRYGWFGYEGEHAGRMLYSSRVIGSYVTWKIAGLHG